MHIVQVGLLLQLLLQQLHLGLQAASGHMEVVPTGLQPLSHGNCLGLAPSSSLLSAAREVSSCCSSLSMLFRVARNQAQAAASKQVGWARISSRQGKHACRR